MFSIQPRDVLSVKSRKEKDTSTYLNYIQLVYEIYARILFIFTHV